MTPQITSSIADELAGVLGALLDTPVVSSPGDERLSGRHWAATVRADQASQGTVVVRFDEVGSAAVSALIMGLNEAPPEAAIADTLREALTQALSTPSFKDDVLGGVLLKVVALDLVDAPGQERTTAFVFEAAGLAAPLTVWIGGEFAAEAKAAVPAAPPATREDAPDPAVERIDVILDIDLPLVVRFGRTELPLRTLARMGPGSLIDLGRQADDPVDVMISNRVVARGEVVIVGGNYGVRILDVVSPKERVRSMEA
jgi:flagellar motor switch protein FliN/FliY